MNKKFMLMVLAGLMLMGLTACGDKQGNAFPTTGVTDSNNNQVADGTDETQSLLYVCGGEVTLADYCILTKPADFVQVTDEDVEEELKAQFEEILMEYPNFVKDESMDGAIIKEGDTVNIDFVGKRDGVAFDGGTGSDYDLTIGSNSFIEDFEQGLIGKTIGTTVDIQATFPEDYDNEELNGVTVTFTVTINYGCSEKDEVDDAYLNDLTGGTYPTVQAYREELKQLMEEDATETYENSLYERALDEMIKKSIFVKILDEDIEFFENDMINYYTQYAQMYGLSVESFVTQYGYESYDAFLNECHEDAVHSVKQYMVLQTVAQKENITISEEEYEKRVAGYMESVEMTREEFDKQYDRAYIEYCILNDMALEFLVEQAKKN